MKTNYILAVAVAVLSFSANAQIFEDDFEYYDLGDMGIQNPGVWSTWSGQPDDGSNILVVDDIAIDSQSGYIGPNSNQNCLLVLLNLINGVVSLSIDMYIPSGSNASLNIQGATETNTTSGFQGAGAGGAGVFNSDTMYFDGTLGVSGTGIFTDFTTGDIGEFPLDDWFRFLIEFNLDSSTYHIKPVSQGIIINAAPVSFQEDTTLGGVNFTSTDANTNYWLDRVYFTAPPIINDIDDFSSDNFSIYPNPVINMLHIQSVSPIETITVYDVVGKLVLQVTPNTLSPSIELGVLNSGIYLVEVTIDKISRRFKIVK